MIKLENVTKIFPGSKQPAVDRLNLEVPEGEVCVLVGPSGCGKTTTMKMINRLIEPSEGKIYINGTDTATVNPIKLRLDIGYVIQEIGLFPHLTIAENIATVPREKRWPADRIRARVDELLDLVGLDPEIYRNRKPSDLSGGQRQRVGVARAMAADPPILLMDEPFGAVDPITRAHLQNEFIRIQEQMKKTIIFVTHDIDEAIKMGDKIAVMRDGKLIQYDTPDNLLSQPADDFVAALVGRNRSIKRLHLIKVRDVVLNEIPTVKPLDPVDTVKQVFEGSKYRVVMVVNDAHRLMGVIGPEKLKRYGDGVTAGDIMEECQSTIELGATLNDALSVMLNYGERYVAVLGRKKELQGIITLGYLLELVKDDAA
ncbi:MAG: betaine/proline/choline family ABC transporter ATP-binding protein [Peptococcaceae bacterium]|nr:betaine/proline/choline family ABC transporter ATP-binding protein [Peptococcaceae bacterium]